MDVTTSKLLTTGTQTLNESALLKGDMPTPCHQLRVVVKEPNENNMINLEVYSLVDSDAMCITVLHPFQVSIPLDGSSSGHYSVYVNGELLGEFDG